MRILLRRLAALAIAPAALAFVWLTPVSAQQPAPQAPERAVSDGKATSSVPLPPVAPQRDRPSVQAPLPPVAPKAPGVALPAPPQAGAGPSSATVPLPPVRPSLSAVSQSGAAQVVPLPPIAGPRPTTAAAVSPAGSNAVPIPPVRPAPAAAAKAGAQDPGPASPPLPTPLANGAYARDADCAALASEGVAMFETKPAFGSAAGCGASAAVELTAIRRRDGGLVKLEPSATLRCSMARAVSAYVRDDLAPAASAGGVTIDQVDVAASYDCRGRNRVRGAKLSEHGRANAFDIRGFGLADGRDFGVYSPSLPDQLRATLMASACKRFSTVLGPGSDGYHEDHLHMDLQQRRRAGSKTCRWRGA